MTKDDPRLAQIHALIHACFAPMQHRINPPSSVHKLTLDLLARQATVGEVWTLGSPPCACIVLTPRANALYLGKLSTAPSARNRGLARALVTHAANRALSLKLPAVELESRIELTENHALFQALGFEEIGRTAHKGFARPTSITFRRAVP